MTASRPSAETAAMSGVAAARAIAARTVIQVAIWAGGSAALALTAIALVTSQMDLLAIAVFSSLIAVIGLVQRRRDNGNPLPVLAVASVNGILVAPFTDDVTHLTMFPALTLFSFIAVLAMPKSLARLYAVWCGIVAAISLPIVVPGITLEDFVTLLVILGVIGFAGWRFVMIAADLLLREEESHRLLFQESPVALLEEDFTSVEDRLQDLRRSGVEDIEAYLADHPDVVREMVSTIELRRANRAALDMIGASSPEELSDGFRSADRADHELSAFVEQFRAVWDGDNVVAMDLDGTDLSGDSMKAVLHWAAPRDGGERDLSSVIVAISDITPRIRTEERLAATLEANRRLLTFEHALAQCSRSLLLGSGEEALEEALATLREAIGADRAYLTVNVADPDAGPSFHVVRSASLPEFAEDEWMGRVIPWSKYPMVAAAHAEGHPFQHVGDRRPGTGWSRSVLTVPVFTEGRWAGSVGFMDMKRSEPWTDEAVRMLEVAAPMLGTFWEREVTRRRLEDLVMSKDRFVASVSHELRTPLAAVLGFAEELRRNASDFRSEELTDMLELIADQSQEMAYMVEDLLVSARADIGTVSIRPQDVYLRSQAEAVIAGLGSPGGKEIRVVGGRGWVWADPSRTRQIIRNLITNAIRYGGKHVVLEAVEHADETVLTVIDDGPGLDESHWEEIFEPYQRAHDAPTQPASIGLGLTVSRQLARLMGGDLTYRSPGKGSVFSLTLPSGRGQVAAPEESTTQDGRLAGAMSTD